MTQIECETKIMEKLKEIWNIYHEYNPEGTYLDMFILDDFMACNNRDWDEDSEKPIYTVLDCGT